MEEIEIEKYLNQSLKMTLTMIGESIYMNLSFVGGKEDGFLFVSHTLTGIVISISKGTGLP
ncbi:hypothetical protein ACFCVQ_27535 [Bacillus thuringiensis]|uniref:hypothetical protein n=1 Tax=Bacillus thuringiensis TaxID=1428 RepID=UPI0035D6440F